MRIRETKEVERVISFEKACVYYMHDHSVNAYWQELINVVVDQDGYIHDTVYTNDNGISNAKFRVTEEREITPDELHAWHIIQAREMCRFLECVGCPFVSGRECFMVEHAQAAKVFLEGKEVIL